MHKEIMIQSLRRSIVEEARTHIGKASYCLRAHSGDAPSVFNCSSFTQYVFRVCLDVVIPRRAYQQKEYGVPVENIVAGNLVFATGKNGWDRSSLIGHVGIATGMGNIIHATSRKKGVTEDSLEKFLIRREFLGACSILLILHSSR